MCVKVGVFLSLNLKFVFLFIIEEKVVKKLGGVIIEELIEVS